MTEVWNITLHVAPILIGLFLATMKLVNVVKDAIRSEISPVADRLDSMEERFVSSFRAVWEHNSTQDVKIEAVTIAHYRLVGAHDVITKLKSAKCGPGG